MVIDSEFVPYDDIVSIPLCVLVEKRVCIRVIDQRCIVGVVSIRCFCLLIVGFLLINSVSKFYFVVMV